MLAMVMIAKTTEMRRMNVLFMRVTYPAYGIFEFYANA